MERCDELCKVCGLLRLRRVWFPKIEITPDYEGQDMVDGWETYYCTERLMSALRDRASIKFEEAERIVFENEDGSKDILPRSMWRTLSGETARIRDIIMKPTGDSVKCPACGRFNDFQVISSPVCPETESWMTWRVDRKSWGGSNIFYGEDQFGFLCGPIVTRAFVDIVENFNLGKDARIHEVQWDEESVDEDGDS